ncbi:MAG TPA: ester cyclase [Mycobacteriales bacterium]|jgi:steroid delta-isomerase-like uncharacterized protein|nr:ester cyclase [Mycobacteriales bacterium]
MTPQRATDVVDRFYSRLNEGDLDGVMSLFADDYVGHWGLGSGGGGADTVRSHLGTWYTAAPDIHTEVAHTVTDGEWVASFVVVDGTQSGDFSAIPASNRPFRMAGVDMFRVRDGRITEGRTICDLGSLFIAAGAVPAMAG